MRRVYEAIGNWFKEASVLVGVFGILDHLIRNAASSWWIPGALGISIALFIVGVSFDLRSAK
jgi:hypothetical protein